MIKDPKEELIPPFNPIAYGLFEIALKSFELLTYKFVTFPKYEFNTFSKKLSSIYLCWVYFSCTYVRTPSPLLKYSFHALHWISPLDRAPGHFGKGIIVIKLILVDFDGHNAYITLKIYTHVVYIHVCLVWKHLRYGGGVKF